MGKAVGALERLRVKIHQAAIVSTYDHLRSSVTRRFRFLLFLLLYLQSIQQDQSSQVGLDRAKRNTAVRQVTATREFGTAGFG